MSEMQFDALIEALPGEEALITLGSGDLSMTLYHPSETVLETVRQLAHAEGLFVRPGA